MNDRARVLYLAPAGDLQGGAQVQYRYLAEGLHGSRYEPNGPHIDEQAAAPGACAYAYARRTGCTKLGFGAPPQRAQILIEDREDHITAWIS